MKTTADVIIVGGGIVGCATAWYLARRGIKDVMVLEGSDSIGHGASSRNGGGVRQSGRDVRELPIAMCAVEKFWPHLSEELGVETEYTQKGNLRLGKTDAHLKKLQNLADSCQKMGLDVKMIDAKEVHDINPYLSENVIGASFCPTDGHANPLTTTLGYYVRTLELGVRFFTGAKVKALEKVKGRVRKVILEDGTVLEGGDVIVAAGYQSRKLINTVGLDIPMVPEVDCALVTEMQPPMFEQMLGTAAADFYGHQTRHGSFVFGAIAGPEEQMESKAGFRPLRERRSSGHGAATATRHATASVSSDARRRRRASSWPPASAVMASERHLRSAICSLRSWRVSRRSVIFRRLRMSGSMRSDKGLRTFLHIKMILCYTPYIWKMLSFAHQTTTAGKTDKTNKKVEKRRFHNDERYEQKSNRSSTFHNDRFIFRSSASHDGHG